MASPHRYPEIQPFNHGMLKVSDIHHVYFEESGNPNGRPVIFFHGGPGSGTQPKHRQIFNPEHYRIILMDQRSCGKSTPSGEVNDNTTQDIIADAETLREHLGIDRWCVFGGSWGSTLALYYAQTYTDKVMALMVYGIFTTDTWSSDWIMGINGQERFFPEAYQRFLNYIPEDERSDIRHAYIKRILNDNNPQEQREACQHFSHWHLQGMSLLPEPYEPPQTEDGWKWLVTAMKMFAHFEEQEFYLKEGQIIADAVKLQGIPGAIMQGRYDICCPPQSAWDLSQQWPDAQLHIVTASHSSSEPELARIIRQVTDHFATVEDL